MHVQSISDTNVNGVRLSDRLNELLPYISRWLTWTRLLQLWCRITWKRNCCKEFDTFSPLRLTAWHEPSLSDMGLEFPSIQRLSKFVWWSLRFLLPIPSILSVFASCTLAWVQISGRRCFTPLRMGNKGWLTLYRVF